MQLPPKNEKSGKFHPKSLFNASNEKTVCQMIFHHDSLLALFDNYLPQDAHEFLNYLLNQIADILQSE